MDSQDQHENENWKVVPSDTPIEEVKEMVKKEVEKKKVEQEEFDTRECFGSFNPKNMRCDSCTRREECQKATAGINKYVNISIPKVVSKSVNGQVQKGKENGRFMHGGNVLQLLNEEEKQQFERDIERYIYSHPYLGDDPIMMDLLLEYEMMKIRLSRIRMFLFDNEIPDKDKFGAEKLADGLRRTMSLYATRMGITYVSRQRKKDQIVKHSPFEVWKEEEAQNERE